MFEFFGFVVSLTPKQCEPLYHSLLQCVAYVR
jgi:hypothetical protein